MTTCETKIPTGIQVPGLTLCVPQAMGLLLETFNDVVWMKSPHGERLLYVNRAIERLYGFTPEQINENPNLWLEAVHPEDKGVASQSMTELLAKGESAVEYRIVHRDGRVIWLSDHKQLIRDVEGRPLFIGGIARDITNLKLMKQLLTVQNAILEDVATKQSLQRVLERLCQEIESFVPNSIASVLLYDEERTHLDAVAAPSFPPKLRALLNGLVPGERVGSCGTAAFTAQAVYVSDTLTDERWASLVDIAREFGILACWSVPIFDRDHTVLGTFAISSTQTRCPGELDKRLLDSAAHSASIAIQSFRYSHALLQAKEEAEAGTRAQGELLANVSHELRTPMTAILGFTQLLLSDSQVNQLPEQRCEDLRTVDRNGKYLLNLIDNLLDLSKIGAGKLELETIACSVPELVEDVAESLRATGELKQLSIETKYVGDLPERVLVDPTRLRQILFNLVGNAVKFTEVGGIVITVACEQRLGQARWRFDVIDSGIGMSDAEIQRVFSPFTQADASTTRRFGGTGLGLAVSRELAEAMGGGIEVTTESGIGSTFSLSLTTPVEVNSPERSAATQRGATQHAAERMPDASQHRFPAGTRFLLVEDGVDNRRLIQALLRKAGAEVFLAENGQEAVDLMACSEEKSLHFDAILMDMQMPVMDGYTATRELRARGFLLPIIALTAHSLAGDQQRCLAAGCDIYLSKPIDSQRLIGMLLGVIGAGVVI